MSSKLTEIEDELKWVEDNIPSSGADGYGIPGDDGYDINSGRGRERAAPVREGGPGQSTYTQLFVFFITMVVVLNLALWASGKNDDQEVLPSDRGYIRVVPQGLGGDDDTVIN